MTATDTSGEEHAPYVATPECVVFELLELDRGDPLRISRLIGRRYDKPQLDRPDLAETGQTSIVPSISVRVLPATQTWPSASRLT